MDSYAYMQLFADWDTRSDRRKTRPEQFGECLEDKRRGISSLTVVWRSVHLSSKPIAVHQT